VNACHASCHQIQRCSSRSRDARRLFESWLPGFVKYLQTLPPNATAHANTVPTRDRARLEAGDALDCGARRSGRDLVLRKGAGGYSPRGAAPARMTRAKIQPFMDANGPAAATSFVIPAARGDPVKPRSPPHRRPAMAARLSTRLRSRKIPGGGRNAGERDAEPRVREGAASGQARRGRNTPAARGARLPRTRRHPERERHACVAEERELVPVAEAASAGGRTRAYNRS